MKDKLDLNSLEAWLNRAANTLRGSQEASDYKNYILPLIFYKRLSDVFEDEYKQKVQELGDEDLAKTIIEDEAKRGVQENTTGLTRYFIPEDYLWSKIRAFSPNPSSADPSFRSLGAFLTEAMREVAKLNPLLAGTIDVEDFNDSYQGQRVVSDERLKSLIEVLSQHRLGLEDTEPDILGRAYEYLIRNFAANSGKRAGEFYTPYEVGMMMAKIIKPHSRSTVYDPTCGSAGLLVKARLAYLESYPDKASQSPKLYGQEVNYLTSALGKMNMVLHDFIDSEIKIGDSFTFPQFTNSGRLTKFDYVVANPMWNQKEYKDVFYENDSFGRFNPKDLPPSSSADWGWIQHIDASLKDSGKAAIVLDTGAVSRGSGSNQTSRERDLRKIYVEADKIESVILFPANLFYNTSAAGIVIILNKSKPENRKNQILLINLSKHFIAGSPKNTLSEEGIKLACEVYENWTEKEQISKIITIEDARKTDYNLSPSQFIDTGEKQEYRPLDEIISDLNIARTDRQEAEEKLNNILEKLGLLEVIQ